MAEGGRTEKQLLGQYVEKQTKYGTTSRLVSKSSTYIKHPIKETDTLMGIALKYGVTVEQIKRENKLWTNDSLFVRETLLIPVASQDVNDIPDNCEVIVIDNTSRSRSGTNNSDQNSRVSSQNLTNSIDNNVPNDSICKEKNSCGSSGMDFLSKFDNSMAAIKSSVQKMEENARFLPDPDDPLVLPPRKNSKSKRTNSLSSQRSSTSSQGSHHELRRNTQEYVHFSNEASPVLMIKSRNSTHKIQTSLERLEKTNDDLFQL